MKGYPMPFLEVEETMEDRELAREAANVLKAYQAEMRHLKTHLQKLPRYAKVYDAGCHSPLTQKKSCRPSA